MWDSGATVAGGQSPPQRSREELSKVAPPGWRGSRVDKVNVLCKALGLVFDTLYRVVRSVILALGREVGAGGSGIGDYPPLHSEFETMLQMCQRGKR